jgi:putative FmdB family regulatory protein
MPVYEWKCPKCKSVEETQSSVKDKKVPKCCGKPMRQVFYPATTVPGTLRQGFVK